MSTYNKGLVAFVQSPSLKTIEKPSLITFETAHSLYFSRIEDVNNDRDDEEKCTPATIKDCVESTTLHALCILGEITCASSCEEATPENVKLCFDAAVACSEKDLSERLDSTINTVGYTESKEDPSGGISNFILSVLKTLDKNNASEVIQDKELCASFGQDSLKT